MGWLAALIFCACGENTPGIGDNQDGGNGAGTDGGPAMCAANETVCGSNCCTETQRCDQGTCVERNFGCQAGETACGTNCCSNNEECIAGACEPQCTTERCGPNRMCCPGGQTCLDEQRPDPICCAPDKHCAGECCGADQLCAAGECKMDCGGSPPCGPMEVCCGAGEVCYLDQCVMPGQACAGGGCATRPEESVCPEGEFCDPGLGRCLPNRADQDCTFEPPQGVFEPVPLFTWGQRRARTCAADDECQTAERCDMQTTTCTITWSHVTPAQDDFPDFYQVTSIPMVVDLDQDCVPEIIFNSYQNSQFTTNGIIRAIRGDNGAKVWTQGDPMYRTNATANPAVGDIDGDGEAEVVVQGQGRYLIALEADGTPKWRSQTFRGAANSGSAAIANLDATGPAEIVFGSIVLTSTGGIAFEGTAGRGIAGQGPISCVADLDGDNRPELIAGNTAYAFTGQVGQNFTGSVRWESMATDGYCGIADFTEDNAPEVVVVSRGQIYLLGGQLGNVIAQIAIPGGGQGGAPNIADFNGDGRPDIGTAGANNYVVATFDPQMQNLSILWQAPTEDDSSSRTGSSVFDFDGDGRAEVVYNDEEFIRIYPGVEPACLIGPDEMMCDQIMTDEEVLFRDLSSSRTRTEYPVIADVNGDFKAEIVFATNNEATFLDRNFLGDAGIEVWRDRLDNWVATRPVWNQHSYHINNVATLGEVPDTEPAPWQDHNSYRRNTQGGRDFCAPDLQIRAVEVQRRCPSLTMTAWVVNTGCLGVGPGVNVSFYDNGVLLGTTQTMNALIGGAAEQVTLSWTSAEMNFTYSINAIVDDDGTGMSSLNECEEYNNEGMTPVSGECRIDL